VSVDVNDAPVSPVSEAPWKKKKEEVLCPVAKEEKGGRGKQEPVRIRRS